MFACSTPAFQNNARIELSQSSAGCWGPHCIPLLLLILQNQQPSGAVEIPSAGAPAFPVEAWLWMVWKLSSIMWICIKNMKRIQQNQHETERHSIFRVCPTLCFGDLTWNLRDHESFTSSDPATSLLAAGRIPQQWNGSITTAQEPSLVAWPSWMGPLCPAPTRILGEAESGPIVFQWDFDPHGYGSKPWYLVNPKIAGKWMFIPLKMYL